MKVYIEARRQEKTAEMRVIRTDDGRWMMEVFDSQGQVLGSGTTTPEALAGFLAGISEEKKQYPENDTKFEEVPLESIKIDTNGDTLLNFDTGCLWAGKLDFEPQPGDIVRLYPSLWGGVRGIFINGQKVRYETEEEYRQNREIEDYGKDAAEWLKRWDEGDSVWSISMGGLGPGYEQCIQIVAAEIVRYLLADNTDIEQMKNKDHWPTIREAIIKTVSPIVQGLGLSGAQWGAGMSLGTVLYMTGPIGIMKDEQVKDRHIQVVKNFPSIAKPNPVTIKQFDEQDFVESEGR